MQNYFKVFYFLFILFLSTCAVQNNVQITLDRGVCYNGYTNAPYCIAVNIKNNTDGQNYINSSNFSISNLQVFLDASYNINYPSNSKIMDPNNCNNKIITAGSICTFFIAINKESYPVATNQSINVTLNYIINTDLFGGGGQNASNSFTLIESTNLYIVSNPQSSFYAYVDVYNANGLTLGYLAESATTTNSVAIDNNSYGYLYIATNGGIFYYGNESSFLSNLPPSVSSGFNNLVTSNLSPLTNGSSATNMYGVTSSIYSFNFASITWSNPLVNNLSGILPNINAFSSLGNLFLATQNNVYNCSNLANTSGAQCNKEGAGILSNISGLVSSMALPDNYTGLYVVSSGNLYVESGNQYAVTNNWVNVTDDSNNNLSNITALTNDGNGNIYAGDSLGSIWKVDLQKPNKAIKLFDINKKIQPNGMIYDNFANILYLVAENKLYKCNNSNCVIIGNVTSPNIIKMAIGSSLNIK
jgi:hypothetical protein